MAEAPGSEAQASKPRVLLSILKGACLEHLEGEVLFTAITAGFGRFECDRLLKPSGVELMNLPPSANIEVSVLRRLHVDRERERQKQLLYHGLVSLAALQPYFTGSVEEEPNSWESWLGLFNGDMNLKAQAPERLFQRCLEMGTSSARFPRLLLRLQYLPPGGSSTSRPSPPTAGGAAAEPARSKSTFAADVNRSLPAPALAPKESPERLREAVLREFFEQAAPSLAKLGRPLRTGAREAAASTEGAKAQLADVAAALAEAVRPQVTFYRPLKTDPLDCMLAAAVLRLDEELPNELSRVEAGLYQLGERRFRCQLSNGRAVVVEGDSEVELQVFLRKLIAAGNPAAS